MGERALLEGESPATGFVDYYVLGGKPLAGWSFQWAFDHSQRFCHMRGLTNVCVRADCRRRRGLPLTMAPTSADNAGYR